MHSIDFPQAQTLLSDLLNKKLMGEAQGASMERRAQKLIDNWFARKGRPFVLVGNCGVQIVGAVLAFDIGTIKIKHWRTRFLNDVHDVHRLSPDAIALGYANEFQLFIADARGVPNIVARKGAEVLFWSAAGGEIMIPPSTSPLRPALDRAKALGYLDHLKGIK